MLILSVSVLRDVVRPQRGDAQTGEIVNPESFNSKKLLLLPRRQCNKFNNITTAIITTIEYHSLMYDICARNSPLAHAQR